MQASTIDDTGANQAESGGTRRSEATIENATRREAMISKTRIEGLTKAIRTHPQQASKGNVEVETMLNGSGLASDREQAHPTEGGDASIIPTQEPAAMRSHARCLAPRLAHPYDTRSKQEARKYRQDTRTQKAPMAIVASSRGDNSAKSKPIRQTRILEAPTASIASSREDISAKIEPARQRGAAPVCAGDEGSGKGTQ